MNVMIIINNIIKIINTYYSIREQNYVELGLVLCHCIITVNFDNTYVVFIK